jgi:hypothetical protein
MNRTPIYSENRPMQGVYVVVGTGLILCSLVRVIWPVRWATSYAQTGLLLLATASLIPTAIDGGRPRDFGLGMQILLSAAWLASGVVASPRRGSTRGQAKAAGAMRRGHVHVWAEAASCAALLLIITHGMRSHFAVVVVLSTMLALAAAVAASVRLERRKDALTVPNGLPLGSQLRLGVAGPDVRILR